MLTGTPSIVAQNVRFDASTWHGVFDAAGRTLIYQPGGTLAGTHLVWFGRDGKNLGTLGEVAKYYDLKLSPDGHRLVTNAGEPRADIWVIDVERDVRTRLTFEGSMNEAPVWSADGTEIIYAARDTPDRTRRNLSPPRRRQRSAPARGAPRRRRRSRRRLARRPLGRRLALARIPPRRKSGPCRSSPANSRARIIAGDFAAHDPRISPDGRWLAYTSNESGRDEIYVVPFLGTGGKWQVTTTGGHSSRWSPDGAHLDYLTADNTLTEVDVQTADDLRHHRHPPPLPPRRQPRLLLRLRPRAGRTGDRERRGGGSVAGDGGRELAIDTRFTRSYAEARRKMMAADDAVIGQRTKPSMNLASKSDVSTTKRLRSAKPTSVRLDRERCSDAASRHPDAPSGDSGHFLIFLLNLGSALVEPRGLGRSSRDVVNHRQQLREMREIRVRREDRELVACRHRKDQEVGIRALDAVRAASVEERRRFFVVGGRDLGVGKAAQVVAQAIELREFLDSGEDFLPDRRR